MAQFQMQAVSDPESVGGDGELYSWVVDATPDWVAADFPGPGTPIHVAVAEWVGLEDGVGTLGSITPNRILGRWSSPAGPVQQATPTGGIELTAGGLLQTTALTGAVLKAAGATVTTFRDAPALTLLGRSGATSGPLADITGVTDGHVPRIAAGLLAFGTLLTGSLGDGIVTSAKFRDSVGLSVVGRAPNTTGVVADITATTTGDVLQYNGTSLVWGSVPSGSIGNIATDRLLGRDTAGTGPAEQLTVSGGIEFTGSGGIQTSAFTGDVTKTAGSTALAFRAFAALSLLANATNGSAVPTDVASTADHQVFRRNGTAIAWGTVATDGITNSAVTFAKFQDVATDRLVGRDAAGTGPVGEIALQASLEFTGSNSIQRAALTGDATATAGSNATAFRNFSALSVLGRSANSTGAPADIAGAEGQILRVASSVLGFGTITTAALGDVPTDRLVGRDTAGTGAAEFIALGASLEFSGSLSIQRAALTGDVTAAANANATAFRNFAAVSVLGRSANSTGAPADIAAGANDRLLARTTDALSFTQLTNGMVPTNTIGLDKIVNIATDTLLGRDTAATGAVESISLNATLSFTGAGAIQRAALTGDITATAGSNTTAFRDAPGLTLLARTANTTGPLANFTASVSNTAPYYNGTALVWGVLPAAALAAPGSTLQLIYNNAGAFDAASGITIVGTETAIAFGATPATVGLIRVGNNVEIIYAKTAAAVDMRIVHVNSGDDLVFGDQTRTANQYHDIKTGSSNIFRFGANTGYTIAETSINAQATGSFTNATFFGGAGSIAAQGLLRGGTSVSIFGLTGSTDRSLVSWASDVLTLGQTTNAGTALAGNSRTATLSSSAFTIDNGYTAFSYTAALSSTASDSNTRQIEIVGQTKTGATSTLGGSAGARGGDATGAGGVHRGGWGFTRGGSATGASGTRTGGSVWLGPGTGATANGNVYVGPSDPEGISFNFRSMAGGIALENRTAAPTVALTGASALWSDSGVLRTFTAIGFGTATLPATGYVRFPGGTADLLIINQTSDRSIMSWSSTGPLVTFGGTTCDSDLVGEHHIRGKLVATEIWDFSDDGEAHISPVNIGNASATSFVIRGIGSTSGNTRGGRLILRGGRRAGTGSMGGVRIDLNTDDTITSPMIEIADLGDENRRVVALCLNEDAITTTHMPSGNGDCVVYLKDADTSPSFDTTDPTAGVVLWSDQSTGLGGFRVLEPGRTLTTLSYPKLAGPDGSGKYQSHRAIYGQTTLASSSTNTVVGSIDLAALTDGSDCTFEINFTSHCYCTDEAVTSEILNGAVLVDLRAAAYTIRGSGVHMPFEHVVSVSKSGTPYTITSTSIFNVRLNNGSATKTFSVSVFFTEIQVFKST